MEVKRIFLFIILALILVIPMVSAIELNPFAKVKSYENAISEDTNTYIKETFNSKYGSIRISKTFFWFETDKIAEYSLTSNTDQCLSNCYSEGRVVLYSDGKVFDDAKFKDNLGYEVIRDYKFYIKQSRKSIIDVGITEEICSITKNGTETCSNKIIGYEEVEKISEEWVEYKGEILKKGEYEWRVEGNKNANERIDFIPIKENIEFSEWVWWNTNWEKKKKINMTGSVPYDYSLKINVTYDSDMETDFADLRFVDNSETTELPYWIQSKIDSNSAIIWVKIPNNNSIYMYYSNMLVTSTSNINESFIFSDDFSGSVLDPAKWGVIGSPTYTMANGYLRLANQNWGNGIYSLRNFSLSATGYYLEYVTNRSNIGTPINSYFVIGNGLNKDATVKSGNYFSISTGADTSLVLNGVETWFAGRQVQGRLYKLIDYFDVTNVNSSVYDTTNSSIYSSKNSWSADAGNNSKLVIDWNRNVPAFQEVDYVILSPFASVIYAFGEEIVASDLSLTLYSPDDDYKSSSHNILFNCSATSGTGVLNLTLQIDDNDNYTVIGGVGQNLTIEETISVEEGLHNWTCRATDGTGGSQDPLTATGRNFTIDTIPPNVVIFKPTEKEFMKNTPSISLNYTITDSANVLDSCWYNIDNGINYSISDICHGNLTITSYDLFNISTNKLHTIRLYSNDSFNNINYTISQFYTFNYSHYADGSTAGEGSEVKFNLSLEGEEINSYYGYSNASLIYAGTTYDPDSTIRTNPNFTFFEKTIVIPSGVGNSTGMINNYSWNYNIKNITDVVYSNVTDLNYIIIYNITVADCNDYGDRVILNLSLRDEETSELVNITSPNIAIIELDLVISSKSNSSLLWTFHKTWNGNNSVAVCVPDGLLNVTAYNINFTIGYDASDKVREFYYLENGTLDNTNYFNSYTPNIINLLDLAIADSTTFLFSFTDENGLEVDDAIIHTFRKYIGEGLFREVERSKQDNNGQTHVHLVEEDVIYYFMITQYGGIIYSSDEYNAKCLSSPCSITLSASPENTNWSVIDNEGGNYQISTDKDTRISTLTFSLDSSQLVNMSLYSYVGDTATLVNSSSLTSMAGTIDLSVPLSYGNKTFFVVIYKNNSIIKSQWVDLTDRGRDYFGTDGAIFGALIVLALVLMSITEGVGLIIFTILGLIIIAVMKLIDLNWLALVSLICAGGIIVWKMITRRNKLS